MDKAELLTGAEVEKVGQDPCSLRAGAVLEVLPDFCKEKILADIGVAPVKLAV